MAATQKDKHRERVRRTVREGRGADRQRQTDWGRERVRRRVKRRERGGGGTYRQRHRETERDRDWETETQNKALALTCRSSWWSSRCPASGTCSTGHGCPASPWCSCRCCCSPTPGAPPPCPPLHHPAFASGRGWRGAGRSRTAASGPLGRKKRNGSQGQKSLFLAVFENVPVPDLDWWVSRTGLAARS